MLVVWCGVATHDLGALEFAHLSLRTEACRQSCHAAACGKYRLAAVRQRADPVCAACRDWVVNGREVSSKEVSLAEAKAIKGLRAVFGEVREAHGIGPVVGMARRGCCGWGCTQV